MDKELYRHVDSFLLENKIKIEDDGFTQKVMQTLPERKPRFNRNTLVSLAWNVVCIILLILFCWRTNVLSNLVVDCKAFIVTLPANIYDVNIWQTMAVFYLSIFAIVSVSIYKFLENKFNS